MRALSMNALLLLTLVLLLALQGLAISLAGEHLPWRPGSHGMLPVHADLQLSDAIQQLLALLPDLKQLLPNLPAHLSPR